MPQISRADVGFSRRAVLARGLAGLAAVPVVGGLAGGPGTAHASEGQTLEGVGGDLARGKLRRFNGPWLTPGTRLRLPAEVHARVIEGWFENRPRIVPGSFAWPQLPATDGTIVDASIVPERDAPSVMAVLSGFKHGRYELVHASGKVDQVRWDARKYPYLWYWGEWGASKEFPLTGSFFHLLLQPLSRNLVS